MFFSSTVSPDQESARITSSWVIMPRSPWAASLGCTKKAGVPVEANVAATFWPMWPLLPMPETMTARARYHRSSTARANGSARPFCRAPLSAISPSASSSSVRSAVATGSGCAAPGRRR